jgi:plastocyanin
VPDPSADGREADRHTLREDTVKRGSVAVIGLLLVATSCLGGGPQTRTAFVDFSHDEFASVVLDNFPSELTVAAGDTVTFRQIWTGEPHTVTGGTLVNEMMRKAKPFADFFDSYDGLFAKGVDVPDPGGDENPRVAEVLQKIERSKAEPQRTRFLAAYDELVERGVKIPPRDDPGDTTFSDVGMAVDEASDEIFKTKAGELPFALGDEEGFVANQNAGQPCFLTEGIPPKDPEKPCPDDKQRQPVYDGTASYYNSGIIPYEGPQGNTFRVRFAEDLDAGSYWFYCAVHGPGQATEIKLRPEGSDIPSQEEVSRRARAEQQEFVEPMAKVFRDASDGTLEVDGRRVRGPFGGLQPPVHGGINEFVPKTIRADVGERVTWKLMGWPHTVTFGVPEYFPIIRFAKNGNVSMNPRLEEPAGGSPDLPEPKEGAVTRVDGGTYDGRGFFSSGLLAGEPYAEYSVRVSRPGRYKFACLLHPPMVGTLVVS